ncbi:DUF4189 domain-containing protein [Noviherbaspirillum galbum]|uniref:DUF4189 domain-containing protein n=1 Tax=Noviherbaspirillum galbum TaxID=2709383 RepID=A0A6B3SQ96_9BURK|nr:DUF4189 domain-containing protein [Noviherbaspirillum galbum]NEX60906.1 DUF4189 domain-containing protein [Noviherbaspirillum galbum]
MKHFAKWALVATYFVAHSAFAVGSIAIDDQIGEAEPAYGVVVGEDSADAAKKEAVKTCKEYGGTNCKAMVWFKKCGAVAVTKKYYGYGYGDTKAVATQKALEMCGRNNCNIVASECEE